MTQTNLNTNLSKTEFETLLLIYAAHVDYQYTQEEIDFILKTTSEENYKKMLDLFNSQTDFACMKILMSHKKKFCKTQEQKSKLFNSLKKIFEIDGDYSRIEKAFLQFFERMTQD